MWNKVINRWYRELSKTAGVHVVIAKLLGHTDTVATERCNHIQTEQTPPLGDAM